MKSDARASNLTRALLEREPVSLELNHAAFDVRPEPGSNCGAQISNAGLAPQPLRTLLRRSWGKDLVCRNVCTALRNQEAVESGELEMNATAIRIGKLDAARRQLGTAITLWFNDGDPVSVHALAYAAYEVVHAISKKRDPNRRDLIFDSALVKDEYRREFNAVIRKHANFFKHADKDGDSVIEFNPALSELFILFAFLQYWGVNSAAKLRLTKNLSFFGG
jgi:hypothetical protein